MGLRSSNPTLACVSSTTSASLSSVSASFSLSIVHDFVQVTFDVASNSTNASATEKSVSISATTGVSNDFGLQPEEAEQQSEKSLELQKFTSESTCTEKEFDFWTLLGGILLGGCLLLFGYSALKFYQYKKKAKNYSEPYTFDTFVNP